MIAGILLAAGGARRFRSQKLVAPLDGMAVVRHSAMALAPAVDRLFVVVGSEAAEVTAALDGLDVEIVENPEWELGLAGSLRCGISALSDDVDAVVVTLGDQPRVDPGLIAAVVQVWGQFKPPIVTARYRETPAHPVVFSRRMFGELLALEGDAGARLLIDRTPSRVLNVDYDSPVPLDVDTPDDLDALRGESA
jgi:molybdenum cofactor cytidylyltransferase